MTRKMIGSFVFALVSATALSPAKAAPLGETQAWTFLGAEKKIDENGTYGVKAHLVDLRSLSGAMSMDFIYAGPTFAFKIRNVDLWLSPQFVGAFNYFEGHEVAGPSLWATVTAGRFGLFLEGEAYFGAESRRAYYGYYSADFRPREWFNLGGQSEQMDKNFTGGPHLGFDKEKLHIEAQYHVGDGIQFFRIQTVVQF